MKSLKDLGISPAVGVILLLGITAATATIAGIVLLDIGEDGLNQTAQAGVEVTETTSGVEVTWTTDSNAEEIIVKSQGKEYSLNGVNDSIKLGLNENSTVSVVGVVDGETTVINKTTTERDTRGSEEQTVKQYTTSNTETVSGQVTINPPISGATVKSIKYGSVIDTTTTDSTGNYSVQTTENSRLEVIVKDFTYDSGNKTFYGSTVKNINSDLSSDVNIDFTEPSDTTSVNGEELYIQNGTYNGKQTIASVEQLQSIKNNFTGDYVLISDIDLTDTSSWNSGSGFILQDGTNSFEGTIDGNGHTLKNLNIDASGLNYIGLIRPTIGSNGVIKDLTITGEVTGDSNTGVLTGESQAGTIQNVTVDATVTGTDSVGGFVGSDTNGDISNSEFNGTVNGNKDVGGITGNASYTEIKHTTVSGSVTGSSNYVGGIAGLNSSGLIHKSYVNGDVEGKDYVGGLVGDSDETIKDSYVKGSVTGDTNVGGLVGINSGTVVGTYNTATVTASNANKGGLIGQNGTDAESYKDGNDGTLKDSYWATDSSGVSSSIGQEGGDDQDSYSGGSSVLEGEVKGLTIENMRGTNASSNMTSFDFDSTWTTKLGETPTIQK